MSCELCSKQWFKPQTLESWHQVFRQWVDEGNCRFAPDGFDAERETLEPNVFLNCLYRAVDKHLDDS